MATIVFFEDINFKGQSRSYHAGIDDLGGFGHKVSSLIVADGYWKVYEKPHFQGPGYDVSFEGGPKDDGRYPNYSDWGGPNDKLMSAQPEPQM
ncbi:MAG: beta/gamma crystallin-related protein [Pseudonocardiaceae bacterium]